MKEKGMELGAELCVLRLTDLGMCKCYWEGSKSGKKNIQERTLFGERMGHQPSTIYHHQSTFHILLIFNSLNPSVVSHNHVYFLHSTYHSP